MPSYYRTLFDISSRVNGLSGLQLMRDVEEVLRTWVQQFFPEAEEILEDPGEATSGRIWEADGSLLRLSGDSVGQQGYFWLRWYVDDDGGDDYQRYLGFRLATEGHSVQADFEIRVGNRESGHFDSEVSLVMDTLLSRYRCATLGTEFSQRASRVLPDQIPSLWERLCSPERCLPLVVVSERRIGGMPVEGDALQRDLLGLAEVVCCTDEVAWQLGWYSWRLLCYDGQVRIYAPGMGVEDDQRRHRLWSNHDVSELGYDAFLQLVRDECAQRIFYPQGRDALRVFSRVRGRVRDRVRADLSRENRQVYDEWAEEVRAKDDEILRWRRSHQQLEEETASLKEQLEQLDRDNRTLQWRLASGGGRLSDGYAAPLIGGDEGLRSNVRTVAEVADAVRDWRYVRIFKQVARDCTWMSVIEARQFYGVLQSLNDCGEGRISMGDLTEEEWMVQKEIKFAGRESRQTMDQYGEYRNFRDDNGLEVQMQPHIRVGKLRMHLRWSEEEERWLVGYFGEHLPTVSQ